MSDIVAFHQVRIINPDGVVLYEVVIQDGVNHVPYRVGSSGEIWVDFSEPILPPWIVQIRRPSEDWAEVERRNTPE